MSGGSAAVQVGKALKLTKLQETFAREFHKTGNASEAFRRANPRSRAWKPEAVHVKACEMRSNGNVQVRIQQLHEQSQERHHITIERLTNMLLDDRELARQLEQTGSAVSAVMGLAKLHGLIIDKAQTMNVNVDFADVLRARLNQAKTLPPDADA